MKRASRIKRLKSGTSGVSLVETLVALGIMGMALGLLGSGIFQSLSIEKFWLDDVVATREVRHAGSWLSGDVMNAEELCYDTDGDPDPLDNIQEIPPDGTTVTGHVILVLGYTEPGQKLGEGHDITNDSLLPQILCSLGPSPDYDIHTAVYEKSGTGSEFFRTLKTNGAETSQQVLSRRISDVDFTRSATGDVLTAELDVEAERNAVETLTLNTFLRRLR